MKLFRNIVAVGVIFLCASAAWFILGAAVAARTAQRSPSLANQVAGSWGPPMVQSHPLAWYLAPTGRNTRRELQPVTSDVQVNIDYDPKQKGLLWFRAYTAEFQAQYTIENPTPIPQTLYVSFRLPPGGSSYFDFSFQFGEGLPQPANPVDGVITAAQVIQPGGSVPLSVAYRTRGTDRWSYQFNDNTRISGFKLAMTTDFHEVDFPADSGSPTDRVRTAKGWDFLWEYPNVLAAQPIAMEMPNVLNAGPVAARISFFAPVSLLFFLAVLLLLGIVRGVQLHPMNYFFLAAGCFAFQLLFTYLVDLIHIHIAFAIAAAVSVALVSGYVHAATRGRLTRVCLTAQIAYMVLFSYSFFFDGLTGITITLGAIATLALLMMFTARVDWTRFDRPSPHGPPNLASS